MACCLLPACQQKMAVQPSVRPDDSQQRPVLPGTIARGQLRTDRHLFTGKRDGEAIDYARAAGIIGDAANGNILAIASLAQYASHDEANYVDTFPFPITREVLEHGRDRYMIYCVVCHDSLGTGHGKIVERGYTQPPSYHIDRLRQVAVGHFFDVITNGYGSMPDYKQQIPVRDRWAIAAYIRALQLSQHFPASDMTADMKEELQRASQKKSVGEEGR
jgi:mono/diheme cytochrome c family protein